MDHERFDTLTRRVFTDLRQSRRTAMATLLGATLLLPLPAARRTPCETPARVAHSACGQHCGQLRFAQGRCMIRKDFLWLIKIKAVFVLVTTRPTAFHRQSVNHWKQCRSHAKGISVFSPHRSMEQACVQ